MGAVISRGGPTGFPFSGDTEQGFYYWTLIL